MPRNAKRLVSISFVAFLKPESLKKETNFLSSNSKGLVQTDNNNLNDNTLYQKIQLYDRLSFSM